MTKAKAKNEVPEIKEAAMPKTYDEKKQILIDASKKAQDEAQAVAEAEATQNAEKPGVDAALKVYREAKRKLLSVG